MIGDTLIVRKPSSPNPDVSFFQIGKFKKNQIGKFKNKNITDINIVEGILFVILRIELLPKFNIIEIDSVGKEISKKTFNQPEIRLFGKMICKECNSLNDKFMIRIEEAIKYGEIDFIHNTNKSN
jgi:hypothetical protein